MAVARQPAREKTVLCIDDDQSNLVVRKLLLESAGFGAFTASSGEEGLKIFRSRSVDAVIVDFSMPDMDGGMVAARMKELEPQIPVIMLTAYMSVRDSVDKFIDALVEKGGETSALIARVDSLVRLRSHSHPELAAGEYVVFADASRRYIDCSDNVCELLGYSRSEMLEMMIDDVSYLPEGVAAAFEEYQDALTSTGEYILRHKTGRPIAMRYRAWIFPDGCMAAVSEVGAPW